MALSALFQNTSRVKDELPASRRSRGIFAASDADYVEYMLEGLDRVVYAVLLL
jgi:hypothetical protein